MTSFSELGLSPATVQAVTDSGYTSPTPIQEQAIPVALASRDILGIAQTGTGKTAAFTLPMIDKLVAGRSKARMPRSLVIEPTRELADQVAASFEKYAKGQKLTWALLIGGVSMDDQIRKLDRGVDVLIATPGRLLDLFERGRMLLTGVQIMVVDEADRMLDMGFIPDLERIFKLTPAAKQTLFFSATMPPEITRLTKQFLKDPTRIEATPPASVVTTITQHIARIPSSDPKVKRAALRALVGHENVRNGIVFCNRKSEVDVVAKSLRSYGFDASPIHGDLDQSMRTKTLEAFRSGELKLLVASDVAARGLDIPDVSHVFNYDVPHHADDYVHRIGRTGRAGRKGDTFMLVTPADARSFDKVVKLIGESPQEVKLDLDLGSLGSDGGRAERPARSDRSSRGERPARSGRSSERPAEPKAQPAGARAKPVVEATAPARAEPERPAPRHEPEVRAAEPRRERHHEPAEAARRDSSPREPAPRATGRRDEGGRDEGRRDEGRRDTVRAATEGQRSHGRDDRDPAVVGFGSDVPAFLRR